MRIDVTDISESIGAQDREVIEQGLAEWRKELPELMLGMYVDISMFICIGGGDWDAITSTDEPIEIVIGIPEKLLADGREFYNIRSHEGAYILISAQTVRRTPLPSARTAFLLMRLPTVRRTVRRNRQETQNVGCATSARCSLESAVLSGWRL